MKSKDQRVWLVTGCLTGFGRHIAGQYLAVAPILYSSEPHSTAVSKANSDLGWRS